MRVIHRRSKARYRKTAEPHDNLAKLWHDASTPVRVRSLMLLAGWSLEDLAQHAGLTKQAWSKCLQRAEWTASQIVRVSRAFQCPPSMFLQISDAEPMAQEDIDWADCPTYLEGEE